MIFTMHQLNGIRSGEITLAYRRWAKQNVKKGTEMKTAVGVIGITAVERVAEASITPSDAKKAGFGSLNELMIALNKYGEGDVYRIRVRYVSEDPRISLREKVDPEKGELEKIITRLERLDKTRGPWVAKVLELIHRNPERRAGDLADIMKMDKLDFKVDVRKLKNLGLTISHEIGYSLSPLGEVVFKEFKRRHRA